MIEESRRIGSEEQNRAFSEWVSRQNQVKRSYGNLYVTTDAATVIAAVNTWYKAAGTSTAGALQGFAHSSNARLIYAGEFPRAFCAIASASGSINAANTNMHFALALNGDVHPGSDIDEAVQTVNYHGGSSTHHIFTLKKGDYIDVWVQADNTGNLTVDHLMLTIFQVD